MLGQETSALRQGDRMREDAVDIIDSGTRDGDEVVADAQQRFAFDLNVMREQQVEVFETDPARLFSIGMTAASTLPFANAAKTSADKELRNDDRVGD